VLYDPGFLAPFDADAQKVEIGKSEKKTMDVQRMILRESLR